MTHDTRRLRRPMAWRLMAGAAVCAGVVAANTGAAAGGAVNVTNGCVQQFARVVDYFPDKTRIDDAVNFDVEYHKSYKIVTVREVGTARAVERYVLVQCGTPAPRLEGRLADAQIVGVPTTSVFASSTTHLSPLVDLGRQDVLTGVSRLRDLTGDALQARVATGRVREFAPVSVIDAELVVFARPAVVMTNGVSSAALSIIRAAGIPVTANTDWLEPTALARAEWLKYIALFLNEEASAQSLYTAVKDRYRWLSSKARSQPESARPLVMTGRSTRGTFTIAGGRSYVAALIKDAGGRYVWSDNPSVGAPTLDLEAQIARAGTADIWINGGGWSGRAAMVADEPRYAAFKAFRQKQVWVYERRLTSSGSNDYWSRSVSHPDLVLADLIKIFHPSLLPGHALEWYMRVPD